MFGIDRALKESLIQWKKLVECGPPRTIDLCALKKADAVLFTDGFSPDLRDQVKLPDRVGAVLFDRCMNNARNSLRYSSFRSETEMVGSPDTNYSS